jgi:8-oxo-dGTP pyrophosphatase MutT (NUDIX family)
MSRDGSAKLRAAGFIIVTRDGPGGAPRILLLRNARHGTWGFPKGHLDDGESAVEAAWRELREETGLTAADVTVRPFIGSLRYAVPKDGYRPGKPPRPTPKRVDLLLGEIPPAVAKQVARSAEHAESAWLSPDDARDRLAGFPETVDLLDRALAVLSSPE